MNLYWALQNNNEWYEIDSLILALMFENSLYKHIYGVYIIRRGGTSPATLYVGQGDIVDRINFHKNKLHTSTDQGSVTYVTWARAPNDKCDGIENYLGQTLKPIYSIRFPQAPPTKVNLPPPYTPI